MRMMLGLGTLHAASFSSIPGPSPRVFGRPTFDGRERNGTDSGRTAETRRAIEAMLESLTVAREAQAGMTGVDRLAPRFNALLQQVKDDFPDSSGLRLIEPVADDSSVAQIAVRLFLVKRTIDAEHGRSAKAS
jgi:hypothetical protein